MGRRSSHKSSPKIKNTHFSKKPTTTANQNSNLPNSNLVLILLWEMS